MKIALLADFTKGHERPLPGFQDVRVSVCLNPQVEQCVLNQLCDLIESIDVTQRMQFPANLTTRLSLCGVSAISFKLNHHPGCIWFRMGQTISGLYELVDLRPRADVVGNLLPKVLPNVSKLLPQRQAFSCILWCAPLVSKRLWANRLNECLDRKGGHNHRSTCYVYITTGSVSSQLTHTSRRVSRLRPRYKRDVSFDLILRHLCSTSLRMFHSATPTMIKGTACRSGASHISFNFGLLSNGLRRDEVPRFLD